MCSPLPALILPSCDWRANDVIRYQPAWTESHVWNRSEAIAAAAGLPTATVGTGSSFDLSPSNAVDLERFGVGVKEMEAGG